MIIEQSFQSGNNDIVTIPAVDYARTIAVPLLMAVANSNKATASHSLLFNGAVVATVNADAFISREGVIVGQTNCGAWAGVIEAGKSATIQATSQSGHGGYVLPLITINLGPN